MNILIIPEDFCKDQYMLKPIIKAMFFKLGKNKAKIQVCQDPLLGGVSETLKWENIESIIKQYPMVDFFILCVDRDGENGRKSQLNKIEENSKKILAKNKYLLAENAWQEREVWVLAGHKLPNEWNWQKIREEIHPKENYFEPFAQQKNLLDSLGEGRKTLAEEAAKKYHLLYKRCPEDLADLHNRLKKLV